jgi:hypothetical protein
MCSSAFFNTVFLFFFSLHTAMLCHAAHSPYKRVNSFVVQQSSDKFFNNSNVFIRITEIRQQIKVLNFLERLGGPDIAVYCLDLFALNYYEFYLLIAAISSNFFLTVDWLKGF